MLNIEKSLMMGLTMDPLDGSVNGCIWCVVAFGFVCLKSLFGETCENSRDCLRAIDPSEGSVSMTEGSFSTFMTYFQSLAASI